MLISTHWCQVRSMQSSAVRCQGGAASARVLCAGACRTEQAACSACDCSSTPCAAPQRWQTITPHTGAPRARARSGRTCSASLATCRRGRPRRSPRRLRRRRSSAGMPPGWTGTPRMSWRRWMRSWATTASWRLTGLLHSAARLPRRCWAASSHCMRGGRWHRRKRLAELQRARGRIQFGSVQPITRTDFVQEVSAASDGCWVVVHLYKDGCAAFVGLVREADLRARPLLLTWASAQAGPQRAAGPVPGRARVQVPRHKVCEDRIHRVHTQLPRPQPAHRAPLPRRAVRSHTGRPGRVWRAARDAGQCGPSCDARLYCGCALWCACPKLQRCAGVAAALNAAGPVCATPDDQPHAEGQAP